MRARDQAKSGIYFLSVTKPTYIFLMHYKILAVCFLILLAACRSESASKVSDIQTITLNPDESAKAFQLDSIVASVRYLQLGSENESIITYPGRLMIWNDFLLVYDVRQYPMGSRGVLFTTDGRAIGQIGRRGKGPGEYNSTADARINPFTETVDVVSNNANNRPSSTILQYDLYSLEYLRTLGISGAFITQFIPVDSQQYVLYHPDYEVLYPNWNYVFSRFDTREKEILNQISPLSELIEEGKPVLSVWQAFTGNLTHPVLSNWNIDTVFTFYENLGFERSYAFAFEGVEKGHPIYGSQEEFDELLWDGKACCIDPYIETENFIYGMYRYETYWGEHFLYSKQTGKLVQFANEGLTNPFNGLDFILPVGSHYEHDELIFAKLPGSLTSKLAREGDSFLPEAQSNLELLSDTLDSDGNYVLIFYKLKDF